MDASGDCISKPLSLPNNLPGTNRLADYLAYQLTQGHYEKFQLAIEAGAWSGWHFLHTLDNSPQLATYPHQLYAFNPRLVVSFKRTFPELNHEDASDATVLADRVRFGRKLPQPFHYEPKVLALRLLTRHHFHLANYLSSEKTYALALVMLKASEYTQTPNAPFSDPFGVASRFILGEFASTEELAALPFAQLVELIDQKGKGRFSDPTLTAKKLMRVVNESYRLPTELVEPVGLVLRQLLKQIVAVELDLKRLDSEISERLSELPNTLQTIPGIGPVFAAGIVAELGDIAKFDCNSDKVAKFAGLTWRKHQSADFEAEETPLTRTGNQFLRYYFCEAANHVRIHDEEYRAYYTKKHEEATKHAHRRAIVLTARKLIRLVVRMLADNQPYQVRRPN